MVAMVTILVQTRTLAYRLLVSSHSFEAASSNISNIPLLNRSIATTAIEPVSMGDQ